MVSSTSSFKHTTHDCTIYQITFKGHKDLLLRTADDCLIQCELEATDQEIFLLIGLVLQLKDEDKLPVAYPDPCVGFNGVDIENSSTLT